MAVLLGPAPEEASAPRSAAAWSGAGSAAGVGSGSGAGAGMGAGADGLSAEASPPRARFAGGPSPSPVVMSS